MVQDQRTAQLLHRYRCSECRTPFYVTVKLDVPLFCPFCQTAAIYEGHEAR